MFFFPNLANARWLRHYFTMRRFDEDDCGCGAGGGGGEVYRSGQNASDDKNAITCHKKVANMYCSCHPSRVMFALHPKEDRRLGLMRLTADSASCNHDFCCCPRRSVLENPVTQKQPKECDWFGKVATLQYFWIRATEDGTGIRFQLGRRPHDKVGDILFWRKWKRPISLKLWRYIVTYG